MWQGIHGHDAVVDRFRASLSASRLASTFLFVGPDGVGKRTFALALAQSLLCLRDPASRDSATDRGPDLEPCRQCEACRLFQSGAHPDLLAVGRPEGRSFIPVDTFVGDKDHRMREGLCRQIALKPFLGFRRIAIVNDADYLNVEGANALLKVLEEPPPRSVLILIGTSASKQLPTIRSRCQIVRFRPLADSLVAELLPAHVVGLDSHVASLDSHVVGLDGQWVQELAKYAQGSLGRALELADSELWSFREQLQQRLSEPEWDSMGMAKMINAFVEHAGRDAAARRKRIREVLGFAIEFFRQRLRVASGASADPTLEALATAAHEHRRLGPESVANLILRSLDAHDHVDRNAQPANLVDCWIDDLHRIEQGEAGLVQH